MRATVISAVTVLERKNSKDFALQLNTLTWNELSASRTDTGDKIHQTLAEVSGVKKFGVIVLVVGIIIVFMSISMDTTVSTNYGGRVNNLGLMNAQQNYLILGCVLFLGGILSMIFGNNQAVVRDEINCPYCAEKILKQAKICKHCGKELEPEQETVTETALPKKPSGRPFQFLWYENNVLAINQEDVKLYASALCESMPGETASSIMTKNLGEIQRIKSEMPNNYAFEFEKALEKELGNIRR